MRLKFFVILGFVILFGGLISADFTIENVGNQTHSINKEYCVSNNIQGWINISLTNEPTDSSFNDSFGNTPTLWDLLQGNTAYTYNCTPFDCSSDYSATNGEPTKSFILNSGESKLVGFKLNADLDSITSVDFGVYSNASADCENQLEINFFNNNKLTIKNNKSTDAGDCPDLKSYGCFTTGNVDVEIESIPFCQRINFSESPAFEIGAWVKGTGTSNVNMEIYDLQGNKVHNGCELTGITSAGSNVSCDVDFEVKKAQEYYVCISSIDKSGYFTHQNSSNDCGFAATPFSNANTNFENEVTSYQIFVQGKKFNKPETLNVANEQEDSENLNILFENYITTKYKSLNCEGTGCVVPIKITSHQDGQKITLKNLELKYYSSGSSIINDFYNLNKTPANVNAGFGKLFLNSGNFSVPDKSGNYNYSLKFDNQEIFKENITVENISIGLSPTKTAFGILTPFKIITNPAQNISSYFWDFGDNSNTTTISNEVDHIYNSSGTRQVKVAITTISGVSFSKTFSVQVNSPQAFINQQIIEIQTNLDNLNSQVSGFSTFERDSIDSLLNLSSVQIKLNEIETANSAVVNESDYFPIIADILKLQIPKSIEVTHSGNQIMLLPKPENIDLNILEEFYNETYNSSNEQAYLDAIQLWNLNASNGVTTKITFKEISADYGTIIKPILDFVKLEVNKQNDDEAYLFLPKFGEMNFKNSRTVDPNLEYVPINLVDSTTTTIEFSTIEELEFMQLPFFVSPAISDLSIQNINYEIPPSSLFPRKYILLGLAIIGLLILAIVIFLILKTWYKKRYETHLFKDRNNLYNLITYINNSKNKGMKDDEIINNLKKAKWSSEQIRYVMRKYAGKKTGL